MFCFKCGGQMSDTAAVCPQCSTPVASAPKVAPPPPPAAPSAGVPAGTPQGYPPQQPLYGAEVPTDGKATASLILGIASLVCAGFLAGIPAIILGHVSKANIRRAMGRLKGDSMATAGLVMGYISVALIPVILIIAAIAIPNLLRARMAANQSAAASTVRMVNTAQVTYSTQYDKGYAVDFATLGGSRENCGTPSLEHACLVDQPLGAPQCTSGEWCTKGQFRYSVRGLDCDSGACKDYVVTATPLNNASGQQSFCATSDAVIRFQVSRAPISSPLSTAEECQAWPVIR